MCVLVVLSPTVMRCVKRSQKMAADRDDELKKIFDEGQFKKWKDEIEPSLRPQRRQGRWWRK